MVSGPILEVKRSTGRQSVILAVDGSHQLDWIAELPGSASSGPGSTASSWTWSPEPSPRRSSPRPSPGA